MKNTLCILTLLFSFTTQAQHLSPGQHETNRFVTSLHEKWEALAKVIRANSELIKDCADGKTGFFDKSCESAFKEQVTLAFPKLQHEVTKLTVQINLKSDLFDAECKARLVGILRQFDAVFTEVLWVREEVLKARQTQNFSSVVAESVQIKYKTAIELTDSLP